MTTITPLNGLAAVSTIGAEDLIPIAQIDANGNFAMRKATAAQLAQLLNISVSALIAPEVAIQVAAQVAAQIALPFTPFNDLIPTLNLPKLIAASVVNVGFFGDSTSTLGSANPVDNNYSTQGILRQILVKAYPTKTFNFFDNAVGGTGIAAVAGQITGAAGQNLHLSIIGTGVNDGYYFTDTNFIAAINASKVQANNPDILFITPRHMVTGTTDLRQQQGFDTMGGFIRSVAAGGLNATLSIASAPNFGVIDIGRAYDTAVLGYDPVEQYMTPSVNPAAPLLNQQLDLSGRYTLPTCAGDFDLTFTVIGGGTSILAAGVNLYVYVDPTPAFKNQVNLAWGTNVLYAAYTAGDSGVTPVNTNVALNPFTGDLPVRVIAKQGYLTVIVNGNIMFSKSVARYNGSAFTPKISFGGISFPSVRLNINSFYAGLTKLSAPVITESGYYGTLVGIDGNGINHPSSKAMAYVDGPWLKAQRLA
jgi:hypothetical protein